VVRNITIEIAAPCPMICRAEKTDDELKRDYGQWWRAWSLLTAYEQDVTVAFCLRADIDVAEVALWL
jgi:hypothetical protein